MIGGERDARTHTHDDDEELNTQERQREISPLLSFSSIHAAHRVEKEETNEQSKDA